ncbi:EboA domain-containing protein [Gilvimarinus algae]|uniref:EboA domain-containing protein n=1 Tax=Gilvimarinus algae TaxID=3058037 RepID=A0ABT8THF0_9GAMM|nr:EboA domain-containing protein [Gilvimarinus sp. SDUM040014]MDO3383493.1 EboA domain-containing protein [Gilvimarinus sp. SDUM040014]
MTPMPRELLDTFLQQRLTNTASDFWQNARAELGSGVSRSRFSALIALASRHAKRHPVALSETEQAQLQEALPGLDMRAWNQLELLRVALVTARSDLESDAFAADFEAQFVYADEGETCALYRALPFLPGPERFVWRAGEGCRTNMLNVFSAIALDSPYPAAHFGDTAWNQLVMKALFLELPLWRIAELDSRLSAELTRMALDFAEERESAGRVLNPGLWLCMSPANKERLQPLVARHWEDAEPHQRCAMIMGLARAGEHTQVQHLAETESDIDVARAIDAALGGNFDQHTFAHLVVEENESQP